MIQLTSYKQNIAISFVNYLYFNILLYISHLKLIKDASFFTKKKNKFYESPCLRMATGKVYEPPH